MRRIIQTARDIGLASRPLRVELEYVPELKLPCIVHWGLMHYVVLVEIGKNTFTVHDPAIGRRDISVNEFSRLFTGIAIEFEPTADLQTLPDSKVLTWRSFFGLVKGVYRDLAAVFAVALFLELLQLIAPFYLQLTVDWVIGAHRVSLRNALALALLAVFLIQGFITAARSFSLLKLGAKVYLTWFRSLFEHTLKLPLSFFERRYLGDLMGRFEGISYIQRSFTSNFLESFLDGLMSLGFLAMMLFFNARLAAVTVGTILAAVLIRRRLLESFRQALREYENSRAIQQSYFLETVRAIQSIKQFCAEGLRLARWSNLIERGYERHVRSEKILTLFQTSNVWLFGWERVFVIWYATGLVMDHAMTLGMLVSYFMYRELLVGRASALLDRYVEARSAEIHLDRLADIVFAQPEPVQVETSCPIAMSAKQCLEFSDVWFRFSEDDPWILRGASAVIEGDGTIAITGRSGCGKSTLLKLLQGLLTPTRGSIKYNGVQVAESIGSYRSVVAAVNQDDDLFIGTIAENISFFDAPIDMDQVKMAARQACIDSDIESMPMQYNTLITDTGLSFSGGQKQRLLLARALYKQAKVLFLDEATSHLDTDTERSILATINRLSGIRVIVAHRPETIASCSSIVRLENGVVC